MNELQTEQIPQINENVQIPQSDENAQIISTCLEWIGKVTSTAIVGLTAIACAQIFKNNDCGKNITEVITKIMTSTSIPPKSNVS